MDCTENIAYQLYLSKAVLARTQQEQLMKVQSEMVRRFFKFMKISENY